MSISFQVPTHLYTYIHDNLPYCYCIFFKPNFVRRFMVKYTFIRPSRYRVRNNNYINRESRIVVVVVVDETVPERLGLRLT